VSQRSTIEHQWKGRPTSFFSETETAEQLAFGHILSFPTQRRPAHYRRERIISATGIPTWFEVSKIRLGASLKLEEKQEAELVLYTWRDLCVGKLEEMPVTDLVEHRIPVRPNAQPIRARDKIYTREE